MAIKNFNSHIAPLAEKTTIVTNGYHDKRLSIIAMTDTNLASKKGVKENVGEGLYHYSNPKREPNEKEKQNINFFLDPTKIRDNPLKFSCVCLFFIQCLD